MNDGLPASWATIAIGELTEVRLGRQRSPEKAHGPHMVPYLRAANVTWGGLSLSDVKEMSFSPTEQETYRLHVGDVLMAEASGSAREVGKPAIWGDEIPGCCFQNTLIRLRPPHGMTKFSYFQILHFALSGHFLDDARGVGIHHLGAERLSRIEVRVAPLPEQARIVAAIEQHLSDVNAGVAALERVLLNLKRYRASVLQAACEGKLVPTEAELARNEGRTYEPADALLGRILADRRARWEASHKGKYQEPESLDTSGLPQLREGWAWARLGSVADVQLGQQRAPIHAAAEVTYPYVRAANITWNGLDLRDVKHMGFPDPQRYRLAPGDVLLSEASGSPSEVGKPAIWRSEIPDCCYQKTLLRVRSQFHALTPEWLHLSFMCDAVLGRFAKMAPGVGILHLTAERMLEWPLPLAPLAEQHRIVAEVDRLLSVADETETTVRAQLARAGRLRRAVLARLSAEREAKTAAAKPPRDRRRRQRVADIETEA